MNFNEIVSLLSLPECYRKLVRFLGCRTGSLDGREPSVKVDWCSNILQSKEFGDQARMRASYRFGVIYRSA